MDQFENLGIEPRKDHQHAYELLEDIQRELAHKIALKAADGAKVQWLIE